MADLLKIEIYDVEKKKKIEYSQEVISLKDYKSALKLEKILNSKAVDEDEMLDEFIQFIVGVYKDQFSYQQAVDGIDPRDITNIINTHIIRCLGK